MGYTIFEDIIGKSFSRVERGEWGCNDAILFYAEDGVEYVLYHDQSCCEMVSIEDICGELSDLENAPILQAEIAYSEDLETGNSGTWTFIKLATIKGYVTVRFYGTSNGWYSETAEFLEIV